MTLYNLAFFMNGDIQAVIDQLIIAEKNAERMKVPDESIHPYDHPTH
jgi:hypothetical protein